MELRTETTVETRSGIDLGRLAALLTLGLAVALGSVAAVATGLGGPDAVPRPLVLGVLYATPGVVALIGARALQPSLMVGAAIPLVPGALLSMAGLTLPFLIPATLLIVAAIRTTQPASSASSVAADAIRVVSIASLVVGSAWAVLLGLTAEACSPIPGGRTCSSAAVTVEGVLVAGAALAAAIALALWWARPRRQVAGRY